MAKLLSWIIMAPLALIVIAFSISNRSPVIIELWPFPIVYEVPVYIAVLGGGAVGFLVGGLVAWVSGSKARARARSQTYRAESAEREAARLKDQISEREAGAARKQALPSPNKAEAA